MRKKILYGLGAYVAAGVVTAAVIPSARGLSLKGKAEAAALWPAWWFTWATGRAGL